MFLVEAEEGRLQALLRCGGAFRLALSAESETRVDPDVIGDGVDHLLADRECALFQVRDLRHTAERDRESITVCMIRVP